MEVEISLTEVTITRIECRMEHCWILVIEAQTQKLHFNQIEKRGVHTVWKTPVN